MGENPQNENQRNSNQKGKEQILPALLGAVPTLLVWAFTDLPQNQKITIAIIEVVLIAVYFLLFSRREETNAAIIRVFMTLLVILAIALPFGFYFTTVPPAQIITPDPTPAPTLTPTPTPTRKTIYGLALIDGCQRTISEKLDVIIESQYDRKENGVYKDGYASRRVENNGTGYILGFYYGDGLLYYAEVYQGSDIVVQLYYWDGELIECCDFRIDGSPHNGTLDSTVFSSVAQEFSSVYEIGMNNY